jgi:hypothetical protein
VERYLDCGNPRCGFARIRCSDCGEERLSLDEREGRVAYRIIDHLKLTFVADKPPPPQIAYQEVLLAAEQSAEYFS